MTAHDFIALRAIADTWESHGAAAAAVGRPALARWHYQRAKALTKQILQLMREMRPANDHLSKQRTTEKGRTQ